MDMAVNAAPGAPRPPLAAVALMAQRAVESLKWLQPLAKVTHLRSIMCEIALLSPSGLTQPPPYQQQQQQEVTAAAAPASAAAAAQPPPSSSSSSTSQFGPVEEQLWQVVRDLVGRLAPPSSRPCRKQVCGCLWGGKGGGVGGEGFRCLRVCGGGDVVLTLPLQLWGVGEGGGSEQRCCHGYCCPCLFNVVC
jgi:hypothetical protein